MLIIDGVVRRSEFANGDTVRLRGVAAGRHSVVLADRAHVGKVFELVAVDGEHRRLEVTLAPREK